MNKLSQKDLTLLRKHLGDQQADEFLADLQAADELFQGSSAPKPSAELLAAIRNRAAGQRLHGQHFLISGARFLARFSRTAAVAAAVLIVVFLASRFPGHSNSGTYASIIPVSLWESDDISVDDTQLMYYNAEVENLQDQLNSLRSGRNCMNKQNENIVELELQVAQMDNLSWTQ